VNIPILNSATLSWDANSEADLDGYLVYVREASASYANPVATTSTPTFTVPDLSSGKTYYFAVSAYNTSGRESGKSNEVSKTFP
jgi:hypothetical protein